MTSRLLNAFAAFAPNSRLVPTESAKEMNSKPETFAKSASVQLPPVSESGPRKTNVSEPAPPLTVIEPLSESLM